MKASLLAIVLLGCGSAGSALRVDQTVKVIETPSESADDTGLNAPPYTFTMPHVSGGGPGVADKMNRVLVFEDFGDWNGSSFDVPFRRGPYIAIRIIKDPTCGAYCDVSTVVETLFDTRTGDSVATADLFLPERVDALIARVETKRLAAVERAFADIAPDADEYEFKAGCLETAFTRERLGDSLSFSDGGVFFGVAYDFPHVAQALEPESPELTWHEVAPFLKPGYRALAGR